MSDAKKPNTRNWKSSVARGALAFTLLISAGPALAQTPPAAAAAPVAAPAAAPVDLSGFWEMRFREYVMADDGKLPPLRPEALRKYNAQVALLKAGKQVSDSATACLPHGTPRIMYTPYPMQILQKDNVLAMVFEVNHNIRLAYFNEKLPEDPDPTYMGHSIAYWDGNTAVIETIGLNEKIQVDRAGLPQGLNTKIVERLTLTAPNKMQNKITVIDDKLYTAPWSFVVEYTKTSNKIIEYVCDNQRDKFDQ